MKELYGALVRAAGSALERGALDSPAARGLGRVWARSARVVRPLSIPPGTAVIGVGGATLGGSYKTPLTLALARALAARGERVAVVAHGYGASVRDAGVVSVTDDVRVVGDEALWLARALAPAGVPVVVAANRGAAVSLAATLAPRVLVDGLLQAAPERLALSVLALDADSPWGARRCPPAGDLRAPHGALLAAADLVVAVRAPDATGTSRDVPANAVVVSTTLEYADPVQGGPALALAELAGRHVGLALAVARPERVVRALAARGVHPAEVRLHADHARLPSPPRNRAPELWLTTPKCATKLGATFGGAPVHVLRHELHVPQALAACLVQNEPKIALP